jgi:hypothetical protein
MGKEKIAWYSPKLKNGILFMAMLYQAGQVYLQQPYITFSTPARYSKPLLMPFYITHCQN